MKNITVAPQAVWLHVKFRVTLALQSLAREGLGEQPQWQEALKLLERYKAHAQQRNDSSLLGLIDETTETIRSKLSGP